MSFKSVSAVGLLLGIFAFSSFGILPAAYSSTSIVLDSAGCASIGGSFSSTTCDITTAVTLSSGTTLIVPSGDTLSVSGSGSLTSTTSLSVEYFSPGSISVSYSGSFGESVGSISTCPTVIISITGTSVTFHAPSTVTSSSVSCAASTGVPEFPLASLSSLLLMAMLLPALLIVGRKFRAMHSPIIRASSI